MNKSDELQSQADAFIHGGSWYESAEIAALQTLLGDAKSFADVGSSIGPYSEAAARCLKNAKILALEAHPQTYQVLCRKMEELAQVCAERSNVIETVHAAASNEAGTIDFYLSQSDILTSTMAPTDEVTKEGMTKVE